MAKHNNQHKAADESILEVGLVFLGCTIVLIALVWLFASNRIVWSSLPITLFFGAMWKWIPSDATYLQWNGLVDSAIRFSQAPTDVSFFDWYGFITFGFLPFAILSFLLYLPFIGWVVFRKRSSVARRFTPDMLLQSTLLQFTGIAPVLAIRKKIVEDKLPEWRVQYTPDDVYLGKAGCRSMVVTGEFDRELAAEYFRGIVPGKRAENRLFSRTLGWQVVDLVADRTKGKKVVFADRMSHEGRVLLALWGAVAFGGDEGKKQYKKYCDLLNRSAYGSPTGAANLSVADPLYQMYRTNRLVNQLFAIHHWEHTVLFALLEIAHRRGRYTTAEVLWLRPMNRWMFFSLNSCGAKVPHVEAAATFAQYGYEKACHKSKTLPLVKNPANGSLMHMISITRCVEGLQADYHHWQVSTDDNKDWWSSKSLWKGKDYAVSEALAKASVIVQPKEAPGPDSPFDKQQKEAAKAAEAEQQDALDGMLKGSGYDF